MKEVITRIFALKADLDAANAAVKEIKERYDAAVNEAIAELLEAGVDRMAIAGMGSVTLKEEVVANVDDWDAFYAYIKENDAFFLMQRRPATNACREAWQMGESIPGVVPFTQNKLSVTKSRG